MKKLIVIIIMLILLTFSFSGCVSNDAYVKDLRVNKDNIKTSLSNINFLLWEYDSSFDWNILMNYLTFTESMMLEMEEIESDIVIEMDYLKDDIDNFRDLKGEINPNNLNDMDKTTYNDIEDMIDNYNQNKASLTSCLYYMGIYREFLNLTRIKLQKLEDYESAFTLMNFKVESEDNEDAKEYLQDIIQLISELKDIENQRVELGIQEYSDEIKGIWDLWLEVWNLYDDYLDLLIDKKYSQADTKYNEYSSRYDDAFEIESSVTITEANSEISEWFQNYIGKHSDLFEDYYEN